VGVLIIYIAVYQSVLQYILVNNLEKLKIVPYSLIHYDSLRIIYTLENVAFE
jgi:hypothetical protein